MRLTTELGWLPAAAVALIALTAIVLVLLVILVLRRPPDQWATLRELAQQMAEAMQKLERSLGHTLNEQGRAQREEITASVTRMNGALLQQLLVIGEGQGRQIDQLDARLAKLADTLDTRLGEGRNALDQQLRDLQQDNAKRLEAMRQTVDEKLQATLEQRLSDSFRQVSERLEVVHRGLGEMQALAADVGDLKRVLGNVKTRGTWGEVQLGALLEQVLIHGQFAANVATVPGSRDRVEFAIRLPGRSDGAPVWLPIDAKFPREDYERLIDAQQAADAPAAEAAARRLGARLREEARTIRDKYLSPPATTDFAILFLPTEGLYAEAVRDPGLLDDLQREARVVVAGPSTLAAILSSLQIGFRTLAIEKRTSEVWQVLGGIKNEFGRFGELLARTREQLDRAASTLGTAESRTRSIERRLQAVEVLPGSPPLTDETPASPTD